MSMRVFDLRTYPVGASLLTKLPHGQRLGSVLEVFSSGAHTVAFPDGSSITGLTRVSLYLPPSPLLEPSVWDLHEWFCGMCDVTPHRRGGLALSPSEMWREISGTDTDGAAMAQIRELLDLAGYQANLEPGLLRVRVAPARAYETLYWLTTGERRAVRRGASGRWVLPSGRQVLVDGLRQSAACLYAGLEGRGG